MERITLRTVVTEALSKRRLDQVLALEHPDYSRSQIQAWINAGDVQVNGQPLKPHGKVKTGDVIKIDTVVMPHAADEAEAIPLAIVYQDSALIILNKPAGLVVHPGAGNMRHTLVNALLNFDPKLAILPRAGLIHRLDKNTTGLLIVARTVAAYRQLTKALQSKLIKREYQAITSGVMIAGGCIEKHIGRHPVRRTKMAVTAHGKPAVTHYRIIKKYQHYTHLSVALETGRTHQIRVHLAHINHPLLGDPSYGKNRSLQKGLTPNLASVITGFKRQALHADKLTLPHPDSGEIQCFKAPLPLDMAELVSALARYDSGC